MFFVFLPDYKGYVRLVCNEQCKVDFHPDCWKKHKATRQEQADDRVCHSLITSPLRVSPLMN